QLNPNQSIFGRYMATRDKKPRPSRRRNVLTTVNPHIDNLAQAFTVGDTKVFGTNGVNNVRFAFTRTAVNRDNDPGVFLGLGPLHAERRRSSATWKTMRRSARSRTAASSCRSSARSAGGISLNG